jgi:hypothetical protein
MIHNYDNSTYDCEYCGNEYKHKSNLLRHLKTCLAHPNFHQNVTPDAQNVNPNAQNVNPNAQNVNPDAQNVNPDAQNVNPDAQNVNPDQYQCQHCKKCLKNAYSLKRHEAACKRVQSLECPTCNTFFTTRQARSRHMKHCVKHDAPSGSTEINNTNNYNHSQVATTINNNTNNNTTNNNLIINNNVYYNDRVIEFNEDHITQKVLKRIFDGEDRQSVQTIAAYATKMLEDKTNVCIRKKHITNIYCDVRTEDGWVTRPDKAVIERFSQDVAGSANDKLYNYPRIGSANLRREITDIASMDEDAMEKLKDLYREIRSVIYQHTKNHDIEENDT